MATLLGIDYGLARIGLAVARVGLAEPLLVLENDLVSSGEVVRQMTIGPRALKQLQTIIQQENIEEIVVGVSEAKMAEKILQFVDFLKTQLSLPINLVDETLSSYEVAEKLKDLPQKYRHGPIDHYAAAIILENYLELC